jgi:hypothetical protein
VIHVVGLPTPLCSHPALQEEWARDYSKVQARDGEETKAFMSAFGTDEAGAGIEAAVPGPSPTASTVAARIPRCLGDLTSPEERNLAAAPAGTLPATVGLTGFARSLRRAETIAAARTVVEQFGRGLWNAARGRAQRARGADFDDRPLYLGRQRAQQTVRAWDPPNPDVRRRGIPELLSALEDASRGYDTASFGTPAPGAAAAKRVVVSGFDPFGGTIGSADSSNPSASAALLLDGTTIGTRPALGRVEGVVFPVRFRDFTEGVAERVMRPLIIGPPPADLVVSISRGGSDFELEEWAGGRRSSRENDNTGVAGNTLPAAGPGASVADRERATAGPVIPGPGTNQEAFRHSVRPSTLAAMRGGRTTPNANEITLKEADESAHTRGGMRERTSPSGQHPVAEGAGGGYLSNEIFYRNRRLAGANTPIPIIHLHVPEVDATDSSRTSAAIARRAKQIIEAALPTLP